MRDIMHMIFICIVVVTSTYVPVIRYLGQALPFVYYTALTGVICIGLYNMYKFFTYKIWLKDRRSKV